MSARVTSLLRGAFGGSAKPDAGVVARVKVWARDALDGDPSIALAVNEIACTDPSCPGVETVILVMRPGARTRAVKVAKLLDAVTEADVRAALIG